VDLVWHGCDEVAQEVGSHSGRGFLMQFDKSEFRGAVDRDEEVKFVLFGADLCDVDMRRWRQRWREDRVRCGMVGCSA